MSLLVAIKFALVLLTVFPMPPYSWFFLRTGHSWHQWSVLWRRTIHPPTTRPLHTYVVVGHRKKDCVCACGDYISSVQRAAESRRVQPLHFFCCCCCCSSMSLCACYLCCALIAMRLYLSHGNRNPPTSQPNTAQEEHRKFLHKHERSGIDIENGLILLHSGYYMESHRVKERYAEGIKLLLS